MGGTRNTVLLHVEPVLAKLVRRRPLTSLARRVLREEGATDSELSIVVTDDQTVRNLNERYRGFDEPTDVLSFGLETDGFVLTRAGQRQLGEVIMSYETAWRQAQEDGRSPEEELAHLLAHGLLHLFGYDHERHREARVMRAREEALLGRAAH